MSGFWRRLSWGYLELGRGIAIDNDGEIDGSGVLVRIELPTWLVRFAKRRLPPSPKATGPWREDISDVLMASLMVRPNLMGILPTKDKAE